MAGELDEQVSGNLLVRGEVFGLGALRAISLLGVSNGAVPQTFPGVVAFAFDPSSVGRDADVGTLGLRTDVVQLWQKIAAGATSWSLITGGAVTASSLTLSAAISPFPSLVGVVNNYAPAGIATTSLMRQLVDPGGASLTGLNAAGIPDGRILCIENLGSGVLTLVHESGLSTAANRLNLPGDVDWSLADEGSVMFVRDGASSRWRVLAYATQRFPSAVFAGIATFNGLVDARADVQLARAGGSASPDAVVTAFGGDPNGVLTRSKGALCIDTATPQVWQNTTGAAVWQPVGGTVSSFAGLSAMWGDASDGNLTLGAGTTVLARDMCWNNLTVPVGSTLDTAGFRVFVFGTLAGGGTIGRIANNGTNGSGVINGSGGGALSAANSLGVGSSNGGNGGFGGTAGTAGGGATNGPNEYGTTAGGAGGAGTGAGGAGGTQTVQNVNAGTIRFAEWALQARLGGSTSLGTIGPGGGGGGSSLNSGGGGGGGGNAYVAVAARNVTFTGTISARGGNGGNGFAGGGATGGGGGGRGGIVVLVFASGAAPTIDVGGGTGGTGGGGGVNGATGPAGLALTFNLGT
jgi:hypothetical protein